MSLLFPNYNNHRDTIINVLIGKMKSNFNTPAISYTSDVFESARRIIDDAELSIISINLQEIEHESSSHYLNIRFELFKRKQELLAKLGYVVKDEYDVELGGIPEDNIESTSIVIEVPVTPDIVNPTISPVTVPKSRHPRQSRRKTNRTRSHRKCYDLTVIKKNNNDKSISTATAPMLPAKSPIKNTYGAFSILNTESDSEYE